MSSSTIPSRRVVLNGALMLAISMTTPVFSIEIPNAGLDLLKQENMSHTLQERRYETRDGRRYRIFLAIPKAMPPAAGYPIIYLLDGNAAFDALTPDLLAGVPNLVIAAIGYEGDKAFDVVARSRDYTPPLPGQTGPVVDPQRPERLTGGAPAFLDDLIGEMRVTIEAGLLLDQTRRVLWGHSYGGLFTLFTLYTRPDAFGAYVVVSPSMWWGEGAIQAVELQAKVHQGAPAALMVMLGDHESRSNQPELTQPRPAPETLALVERLSQRQDLTVSSKVLEGAKHGQTLRRSLPFALNFAVIR